MVTQPYQLFIVGIGPIHTSSRAATIYRMAGKFGGNLIWRIGLQFHLADFNLVVLFLQAMMSYIIVMRRNVTRTLRLVRTCSIEVSKWKYGG